MRIRLRSGTKIIPIVVVLCFDFSFSQTDASTTASANFLESSTKTASLSLQDINVAMTTKTTTIKPTHARISKIEPSYGPLSGATRVTISGQDMTCPSDLINVQLINGTTQLTAHNCSKDTDAVICLTPPYATADTEFRVEVSCDATNNNGTLWRTNDSIIFTYKPDPFIINVSPKQSILAGGIRQTVTGTNLDSAVDPQMWNGFDQPSSGQGQPCIFKNSTMLIFQTQPIDVGSSSNDSVRNHPDEINTNGRKVWIGFIFDGYQKKFDDLHIFQNPEVDKFKPETKDYLANGNNVLTIRVVWPLMNFSADDLTVEVASRTCTGVQWDKNSITCYPPPLPKSVIRYGPSELNTVKVAVSIGYTKRYVGLLHYMSTEPFHVVIIVMIAILAFIFVASCAFGCCTFFGPRVNGCRGRSERNQFRSMSEAFESTQGGSNEKDGSSIRGVVKRRGKLIVTDAAEREGPIECVAMEYQGDGKDALRPSDQQEVVGTKA